MGSEKQNPKTKNAYHIGGVQVEFPYRPYGTQLAFMGRVISTLDRRCHALLESPTGTGKSLSLLCSTLAWQRSFASKMDQPDPKSITDPLNHGGGFIPNDTPPSLLSTNRSVAPEVANSADKKTSKKKKKPPTIYYASRTHSQLSQVIREYRKTSYRVPMAVLGSKRHYCTNPNVRGKPNIDEQCKVLLSKSNPLCREFKNYAGVKSHPSLQQGGCHEVHDIEDLVKVGEVVQGCSYYAARAMARDANLVFCPYNYIVNPVIRGAMEVDIKEAIVILDEAHNMEDIARDAGSVDVDEETLFQLDRELEGLCEVEDIYPPLYEMTQGLISWIDRRKNMLLKRDFQLYVSCWTGDKALKELEEANISQVSFQLLYGCAIQAIQVATNQEEEMENVPHISGTAVLTLEGLFSALKFLFSRDGSHVSDYQLALQKHVKRDAGVPMDEWTHTFSLWCLNPAVVFKEIAELSLSVILTSGTLSPMDSFSSELGVQFGTTLEAQHVIDVKSQVWPAIISTDRNNLPMNASYRTAHEYDFQDALGKSLEEIFRIVPGGCLVFFPSYKLMEKLSKRWCETGQWSQLNEIKSLFVEPRGGNPNDFESVLNGYYDAIRGVNKPVSGRRKRTKKVENFSNHCATNRSSAGAGLLAVCRGKVSEGIDFSDDHARVVIIVGIPFPNVNDIQVDLKKKYNDAHKSSKCLLSGSEWYCYQAFRALNQAAGRCIRHRSDYGAIIFLDERYREARNRAYLSKWLRSSVRQYDNFDLSLQALQSFFSNIKERVNKNMVDSLESNGENVACTDQSRGSTRENDAELNKSDPCRQKQLSLAQCINSLSSFKSQSDVSLKKMEEDVDNCREVVDLCGSQEGSRYTTLPSAFPFEDPEGSTVKETQFIEGSVTTGGPMLYSKVEAFSDVSNRFPSDPYFICNKSSGKFHSMDEATPQKDVTLKASSLIVEMESSLNVSVDSCCQKQRHPIASPVICLDEERDVADGGTVSSDYPNFSGNSLPYGDISRKIDFDLKSSYSEEKPKSIAAQRQLKMNKKLHISCSLCKTPLGLPENQQFVMGSLISSSKSHLEFLRNKVLKPQPVGVSEEIHVLITHTSSVEQKVINKRVDQRESERGIWCEKDGCVYNSIFCPFCCTQNDNLLGVHIMATDESNTHLLNKVMFYADQLEIKNPEASISKPITDQDVLQLSSTSSRNEANSFDRFAFTPQDNSRGWITTKSKLRLPKRGRISSAECGHRP